LDVHDNGTSSYNHGFYISSSDNLIEDCDIYNNAGWGVHIYSSSKGTVNNNTVRNNQIYDNARAGEGRGIILSSGTGNTADNNVIWGNKGGVQIDYSVLDTYVHDNTLYDNSYYGIYVGQQSTHAIIEHNRIDDNPAIYDRGVGTTIIP
jgi:parallel beta-helix repeat protein